MVKMVEKKRNIADNKVEISFRLTRELVIEIKTRAAQQFHSNSDIVEEGMREYLGLESIKQDEDKK